MTARGGTISERALLVGLGVVPLVMLPSASDIFGLPKFLAILLAVTIGWAAWPGGRRPLLPMGALEWAVVAYVAVVALSTLFSRARVDSLFGSYQRYGGLLPLLVFLAFAALFVVVFGGRPDRLALVPVPLVGAAAVVGAYVLLQTAGIDAWEWHQAGGGSARFHAGTMGNPDFAGAFLGIALPFGVTAALRQRPVLFGAATCVAAAGLVATRSRGGLLAGAVGLAVLAVLERDRLSPTWRRALVAGALAAVALAATAVAVRPAFIERTGLLRTESVETRGREWAGGWQVFLDSPVLGTGPDTFEFGFPAHRSREDGAELGLKVADKPHNVLLEKATDTGVLGLAAYLAVIVLAFRRVRRGGRQAAVFAAGLSAYLAQALVSIDVPTLALLGWVMIAGIVAAAMPPPGKPARTRPSPIPRLAAVSAVAVLAAVLLVADMAARDNRWGTAVSFNPVQPQYRFGAGFAAERGGDFDEAVRRYDEVLRVQPRSVHAWVGKARAHSQAKRFPEADVAWRRAAALDPQNWEVHNGHALALNSWANASRGDRHLRTQAAEKLEATVRIRPDHAPAWSNLAKLRVALGDEAGARQAATEALRLQPDNAEAKAILARQP